MAHFGAIKFAVILDPVGAVRTSKDLTNALTKNFEELGLHVKG